VLLVAVLIGVALGVGAPFVIEVIAGPGFGPAADVLRLHALAFVGAFTAAVFGYALLSLRRHREVLAVSAAALLAMLISCPILAELYGARGGAGATAISEATLAAAGAIALARTGEVDRIRFSTLPRLLLSAAVGIAVPTLLGLSALPAAIVAIALCAVGALVTGAVPAELLVEARSLRFRRRA
jgi:O-antigen/teichoic acid export membrane protein